MRKVGRLLLISALMVPLFGTGCGRHRYAWTPGEQTHYAQWEHDTNRQHVDYDRRNRADQNSYWNWRKHHR